ncbi:TPA: tail fiber protein [Salmonella enterica subsp. enterica serovar Concord]|nr:phage tail protein [Salmonella enterica]HDO8206897.1 tail fiber protein [Salmonella enterica subsp. enterica serovar Concord]HDO8313074.1 tail fiber protein [Salmonella enterica subsp. enterica serovar Concord]HDO8469682.1 tail fiber protein [Salmonella enterica subsp. enterica serovar Concord]HDO8735888.1 tail fiber protein [Salmonella enterica subsp. enterica serovar Concord]HDO8760428.1 tail fiber protein [Salmonella enterica subsp. enterica serovar Concord]
MNDVTVVTSVTYPSPESLALVADVQYHEPYLSAALNRKFRGIVDPGFYAGFLPKPGGGMNLLITSVDGDKTAGAASVDIGEFYQVTIQHRKDISLALSAGKKYAIVLKGRYLLGEDTYQVNTASHIHAAEFVARTYTDSYQLGDGELLVCTVNIPAGVSAITQEMIDTSERINRTIGIDISDSVTSSRSDVAASSLAVKKAYDLAKSKYTAQDASTTQKGLVQLSSETNSDSETMAATPKAVKSVKDLADTKAPIESPSLTGTPTAPTAAQGTNSTQIANTAFVKAAITALINGAPGTLDTLKEIAAAINNDPNFSTTINNALALKAPLASPALTGIPTAPTAAQGTNNTQIATTAYVRAAISALVGSSPEALDTLNELAAALGNDPNFATTMTNALAGKQPLDATLTALAGLATGANKLPYFTGTDTVSQTDLTSVGRDILAKTSVLAVIQYLGLRELGTSGEKIPLLSTANTWSARQTFNGGITGALTGNADTATKLKTAININGVRFDGSADININTLVSRGRVTALGANAQGTSGIQLYEAYNNGYPSPYGNVLHLKGATAAGEGELFIGWSGTSGDHAPVHIRSRRDTDSANWSEWAQVYTSKDSVPGVNAKGNQDTSGNAATATKLQTARTINGVSFDGSKNIELTAEDLNLQEFINKANNAVQRSGDILSGGLTFENDSILAWIRNTDWAKIGFKNDADSDTDSYMWFETGDNGNEYFKWRSKQSTTTKDLMNLKWDALSVLVKALFSSEVKISTVNALRIFNSSFGAIFRRSEECLHIIPTRENEGENGDIGPLRPFTLNLRTGRITMGHGLDVTGDITTNAWVYANRFAINSGSTSWIDMRNQNVIFGRNAVSTSSAQALLRQDHAERKFFVGGLGNYQFGFYMINNSRTANGTDGQAYMDNNGNWLCGAQVIPGNYGNFDSRYVRDVRLGTRVVQLMARGGRYEKAGHAITGLRIIGEVDGDDEAIFRPIQKYINGTWYNVAQV